jgi:hypothetical protein
MPLLGRGNAQQDLGRRCQAFWDWWATAKDRVAPAIEAGGAMALVDEISRNVDAVHPKLAWELAKGGAGSRHAFCVSPEGDAEVRPIALAWLASAPPADETWEYHASRQPGDTYAVLEAGGLRIDLSETRAIAGWDEAREVLKVRLWNPAFARVPPSEPIRIAFLFLDHLLGEDDVERWIGQVDIADAPFEGRTPAELREEIARHAEKATHESWVLADRTDQRGNHALVSANAALKRIDFPFAMHHTAVSVGVGMQQLAGHPDPNLDAAEDELIEALKECGSIYAGHVTEQKKRTYYFVTHDPDAAASVARSWAATHKRLNARVDVKSDPRWEFRRDLLG